MSYHGRGDTQLVCNFLRGNKMHHLSRARGMTKMVNIQATTDIRNGCTWISEQQQQKANSFRSECH